MTEPSLCAADTIAGRPMSVLGGKIIMRKRNALFGMYGVSAVEFAAPDRPDLCMAIRQSRKSHGRDNGGYACACSTQINYVSLLLGRLLRPVRAAARTRSRCLAQVRHPQDPGIL